MTDLRRRMLSRRSILVLSCLWMLALAGQAWGCAVCYGDSDDPILKGAELSVLFMVMLTYGLIGAGIAGFLVLRQRSRRLRVTSTEGVTDTPS